MSRRSFGVAGLIIFSLCALAWFVVGIRQAHDTNAAAAIVTGASRLPAGQRRHAADLLSAAKVLNPDTQVDVLRAELALGQGDRAAARRILEQVVAKEPENAVAWEWLARASVGDLHEFFLAGIHLARLVPRVPPPR